MAYTIVRIFMKKKRNLKNIIIAVIFSFLFIIASILGTYQLLKEKQNYRNYRMITGKYEGATLYSTGEDGATYYLTYRYYVGGKWYTVTTDYGTSFVPKKETVRKIRYNKENPEESSIIGVELSELCFLIVIISFLISSFNWHTILFKKKKNKIWDAVNSILIGFLFIYGPSLIYQLITGTKNLFSIFDMISSYGLALIIVIFFALIGIYLIFYTIYSLFSKKGNSNKDKKNEFELEQEKLRQDELEKKVGNIVVKSAVIGSYITIISKVLLSAFILLFMVYIFYVKETNMNFLIFLFTLPFVTTALVIFLMSLLDFTSLCKHKSMTLDDAKKREKIKEILASIQIIVFFLFWFGFLAVASIVCIKDGDWQMALFTIPFWLVGVFMYRVNFKRKKK